MIYAALVMALVGQLWFLVVAWTESKLMVGVILAPTAMAYLMQTGLMPVGKWAFAITALVAGLAIIAFAIYHIDRTWLPVLMILGGNIWFHQQGGMSALGRDVDDKKARLKKKNRDAADDEDEQSRLRIPGRGRWLALTWIQKDMSMPASCSLRRAWSACRQGAMAMAPSTVPARASIGTRNAMREKKPDARESRTHAPMANRMMPLSTVPPRAAQPRVLKILSAKNTAATPARIIIQGTVITQSFPVRPTSLS
jgi:hypothetical protein